jgi:hexosaminidase
VGEWARFFIFGVFNGMTPLTNLAVTCILAVVCSAATPATNPTTLTAGDLSLLPQPQRVNITGPAFRVSNDWSIRIGPGMNAESSAVEALKEGFDSRHHVLLNAGTDAGQGGPAIVLSIQPAAVEIGAAQDRDRPALAAQAYRITLNEKEVRVVANADAGLFYGVETLVQLVTHRDGGIWLPAGEIVDWPDLQLREIYWDDAHHLERLDAMRHAIRQAAFFKINGFVLKLEGHFQFKSAPAVVEPYALSPAEYQELTDYGLRYHVQLIPYLDAPAHIAFILKHPEYASLRAFPDSNYELSTVNPNAVKLIEGMCRDLIDANKGVDYFYLSTDEPYYLGKSEEPPFGEAARMKELGSPGKLLAEFLDKTAGYLHDRGRTVVFWGEYPLKPADVPALPAFLVNGETNEPDFDAAFKARGIRQMIYTSTEGEERLFPNYALAPADRLLHDSGKRAERVAEAIAAVQSDAARQKGDLMGLLVAGWADMGLHPETFWLGYATIASAGWNPTGASAGQNTQAFYRLFYGPSAARMDRIYELMSRQAQFWEDSWEGKASTARKGIWGNSNSIFRPRHPAHDQTIPLPPVPEAKDLGFDSAKANERRSQLVAEYSLENDELMALLTAEAARAEFNRYNIEVMRSIAGLCRQNLAMLHDMDQIDQRLAEARAAGHDGHATDAVAAMDAALDLVGQMRRSRDAALIAAAETWYKSWQPRVAEANGRKFLHELDDVKDHLPDRTVGMDYLVYRELQLPLGEWAGKVLAARNQYAKAHGLAERREADEWVATDPAIKKK